MVWKVRLNLAEGPHPHVLEVSFPQARLAQHLTQRRPFEGVQVVLIAKTLIALPCRLNVVEQVAHVVGGQLLAVPTAFRLAGRGLQEVGERPERERTAIQRRRDCLQINE